MVDLASKCGSGVLPNLPAPNPSPHAFPTFTVSVQRITLFAVVALVRLVMDYSYVQYLSPENAVENNFTNTFDPAKGVQSWVLMLICAAFLPLSTRKPSDFLLTIFFIFPLMGTLAFFAYLDGDPIYAYFVALSFLLVATTRNMKFTLPPSEILGGARWTVPLSVILVVFTALTYYLVLGTSKFQLNVMDVYDVRLELNDQIAQNPLLAYVGTWTWTVVTTFLIAWAMAKRRWFILILMLVLQLYFFGATSAKAALFYPLLVFISYFFARPARPLAWLFWAVVLFVGFGILEEKTIGTYIWNHLLVRRVLWDAARLNWSYYELFSRIGHVYLSENVLSSIISYPFNLDPQHLVGLNAYGRADADADTGFLGTAYMHFGPAGVVLFSLLTGLLLRLADILTLNRMSVWMGVAIVIGPFYALCNDSDLPTALLTHGLALAMGILFLYGHFPREKIRALVRYRRARAALVE